MADAPSAKEIRVAPVSAQDAGRLVRRLHYSGKTVNNSQLHLGVWLRGRLEGAMQFGPSLDKRRIQGLVRGTKWHGFLELNRMAFSEALPRNSESRALSVAMRIIARNYPQIEWIVSFADATQCGDGAIYRASGFVLTGIKKSENLVRLPDGSVVHKMTLESSPTSPRSELGGRSYYDVTGGRFDFSAYCRHLGVAAIPGYQMRYIYFVNPAARDRLTVPEIPFSRIDEIGAGMYKGEARGKQAMSEHPSDSGGAAPTPTLHT